MLRYLRTRLARPDEQHRFGKALTGDLNGLWRHRIGDIRMIVSIKDETVTVLVLRVAHRREAYG